MSYNKKKIPRLICYFTITLYMLIVAVDYFLNGVFTAITTFLLVTFINIPALISLLVKFFLGVIGFTLSFKFFLEMLILVVFCFNLLVVFSLVFIIKKIKKDLNNKVFLIKMSSEQLADLKY